MSRHTTIVRGHKGGKGGSGAAPRAAREDPNTLQSFATARVVELASEGPCHGLTNDLESVFFDGTPVLNPDGTQNFNGVRIHQKLGYPDGAPIPGLEGTELEKVVEGDSEVTNADGTPAGGITGSVARAVTDLTADAIRVKIYLPALTEQNTSNGDLKESSVNFSVQMSVDGAAYVTHYNVDLAGKTVAPYQAEYRVEIDQTYAPPQSSILVRVVRNTIDADTVAVNNRTYFSSYTVVHDVKLSYPHTAMLGVEIDSSQFGSGSIPTRHYEWDGRILSIPNNWDPETRLYSPSVWDGGFVDVDPETQPAANNPVWIVWDLLTNKRYGLGERVSPEQIDKFAFHDAAQYCDGLVDDGNGGTEPRYVFDGIINTRQPALTVLQAVCASFRGQLYWGTDQVSMMIDKPESVTKLVDPSNVVDGRIEYSGGDIKDVHTIAQVTWWDRDNEFRPTIEVYEDPEAIEALGVHIVDLICAGCTSQAQARRYGKAYLYSERHENEMAHWKASQDHMVVRPGEIVEIADPVVAGERFGGRIKSFARNSPPGFDTLVIDSPITQNPSVLYSVVVELSDGTISASATHQIGAFTPSPLDTLILTTGALDAVKDPDVNQQFVVTSTPLAGVEIPGVSPTQWRVLGIEEVDVGLFNVSAIRHDPNKYAIIEENIVFPETVVSQIPTGALTPVTDASVQFYETLFNGAYSYNAEVSWRASTDARVRTYEFSVNFRTSEPSFPEVFSWVPLSSTSALTTTLPNLPPDVTAIDVKIVAVDGIGNRSPDFITAFDVGTQAVIPGPVQNFSATTNFTQMFLTWDALTAGVDPATGLAADTDLLALSHYEIRYSAALTGATWGGAEILVSNIPKEATSTTGPALSGTWFIKAFDITGRSSEVAAEFVIAFRNSIPYNLIQTLTEDPAFSGTKTNTQVVGNNLQLVLGDVMADWAALEDAVPLSGILDYSAEITGLYDFATDPVDLGAVFFVRVSSDVNAGVVNVGGNFMSGWFTLAGLERMSGDAISPTLVEVQVRVTDDDPGGAPTWSDWIKIPASMDIRARGLEFRLRLVTDNAQYSPDVDRARVDVELPTRSEQGTDTTSAVGAKAVTYAAAFQATPDTTVTVEDEVEGDYFTVDNKTREGFDINMFAAGGGRVARAVAYIATGSGQELS